MRKRKGGKAPSSPRKRKDFEITFYEGVIRRSPNYVEALIPLAEAYTRKRFYKEGLEIDKRLSRLCKDDPIIHYNLACSYALFGQPAQALLNLQRAIALGYNQFEHMLRDPDLKSLHQNPDFHKLIAQSLQIKG